MVGALPVFHEDMPEKITREQFLAKWDWLVADRNLQVNDGWLPLIDHAFNALHGHEWEGVRYGDRLLGVTFPQIKEKFGGLRLYYQVTDDAPADLDRSFLAGYMSATESIANTICEQCGEPGYLRRGPWLRTACDKHEAEYRAEQLARFGSDDD